EGVAILDFQRQPGAKADAPLSLDTRGLAIDEVGIRASKPGEAARAPFTTARFQMAAADAILGSRLTIDLTPDAAQVRIAYRTAPSASALQWLEPSLTAGMAQ